MKSIFLYFLMYTTTSDGWKEDEISHMVIECVDALFVIYNQKKKDVDNFFLNQPTKKPASQLKRSKILIALSDMVQELFDISCAK